MDIVGPFNPATGEIWGYGASFLAKWVDANPGSGIVGAYPTALAFTHPQQEIVNAIAEAGLTPDHADLSQLWAAIQSSRIIDTAVTKTVFGVDPDFSSVEDALEWVSYYRIALGGSVTFQSPAGQYAINLLSFDHPDASRIFFEGAALTGGGWPAASAWACTGYGSTERAADLASNLVIARARIPTEFILSGSDFWHQRSPVTFKRLLISGDSHTGTLLLTQGTMAFAEDVVVAGAGERCVAVGAGGSLVATRMGAFGGDNYAIEVAEGGNLLGQGDVVALSAGDVALNVWRNSHARISSGNKLRVGGAANHGMFVGSSSAVFGSTGTASAERCGVHGFYTQGSGSNIDVAGAVASNLGDTGFVATHNSYISAPASSGGTNGGYGYAAYDGGRIQRSGGTCTGSTGSVSPTLTTDGNRGAMIT